MEILATRASKRQTRPEGKGKRSLTRRRDQPLPREERPSRRGRDRT
jgi:hypothetical protein